MSAKKYFGGALSLVAVVVTVSWWLDGEARREADKERETILEKKVTGEVELQRAMARVVVGERELAEKRATLDALNKQRVAAPSAKSPAVSVSQGSAGLYALIRNEPDTEAFYLATKRADLAATYGSFFRRHGLSPDVEARFQDAIIKLEETRMDLAGVRQTQGVDANDGAVAALQKKADADYDAALRDLLGDSGYQRFQDYGRTAWIRGMVSAMAGVAVVERAPFSAQQVDAVVQVIANANESYGRGGYPLPRDVDWGAVEIQVRGILSDEQFRILTTMDPGPNRVGFVQMRMNAIIERAKQAEAAKGPGK